MSVQSPIYIMWGLMLPYPKPLANDDAEDIRYDGYTDSAYDIAPKPGVTVLLDGMGGQYVAIGHVLARSGPYGDDLGTHEIPWLHWVGDPLHNPDNIKMFSEWRNQIENALKATSLYNDALGRSFGWHVIQHYR